MRLQTYSIFDICIRYKIYMNNKMHNMYNNLYNMYNIYVYKMFNIYV